MDGIIFISYRRGDGPGFAGRLYDRLEQEFSAERVFLDVDNIAPGLDFVEVLHDKVAACDVLLAVIGRNWADARDGNGELRLHNPDDFVRIEIEQALGQGKRVIPVLVDGADMPPRKTVPESLHPLLRRNAVRLTHEGFRSDVDRLVTALEEALADIGKARKPLPAPKAGKESGADKDGISDAAPDERAKKALAEWGNFLDAAMTKAGRAPDEFSFEALREETLKLKDTSKMIRFLYAKTEGEQRVSQVRDLLEKMGVTTRDKHPISYQFVFNTVNRPLKRDDAIEADLPRKTREETQVLKEQQEKEEAFKQARLKAAADKAAWRPAENGPLPPLIVSSTAKQEAGTTAEKQPLLDPALFETPPRRKISRRIVLGGAAAGAVAAAWLTRESWLPGSGGVRTLTEPVKIADNGSIVRDADFSPTGDAFAMAGEGGKASIWVVRAQRALLSLDGHTAEIGKVAYAPAGRGLLTASADGTARIWRGQEFKAVTVLKNGQPVLAAGWSRDETRVATAGTDIMLWDAASGKLVERMTGHQKPVLDIAFASWGGLMASASEDGTAGLWNAVEGWNLTMLRGHTGPVVSIDISPRDGHIVTASKDATARLWYWDGSGKVAVVNVFQSKGQVASARFSPDGLQSVIASDGGVALLEAATGRLEALFEGHEGPVASARFSHEGVIVTASHDGTARLLDGRTLEELAIFKGHTGRVLGAKFSPDGTSVLTWSDDGTARVWRIPAELFPPKA